MRWWRERRDRRSAAPLAHGDAESERDTTVEPSPSSPRHHYQRDANANLRVALTCRFAPGRDDAGDTSPLSVAPARAQSHQDLAVRGRQRSDDDDPGAVRLSVRAIDCLDPSMRLREGGLLRHHGPGWDSGGMSSTGKTSYTYQFASKGTFNFVCSYHKSFGMTGTITVS
jgi:hypothetical protein